MGRTRSAVLVAVAAAALIVVAAFMLVPIPIQQPSVPPRASAATRSAFHDCDLERYNPVRISDFFTAANTLSSTKPNYPRDANDKGIGGQVAVQLLINLETGSIEKVCAYSGPPELWFAAEEAAAQWRFKTPKVTLSRQYATDFLAFNFIRSN